MEKLKGLTVASAATVGLIGVASIVLAQSRVDRPDCPGQISCPKTGETVCRDKCPTIDSNRADCPGRIVCPLTGNLVCKDRCPANENSAAAKTEQPRVPSCCAKNKR